jgi:prevent-host-death family protein
MRNEVINIGLTEARATLSSIVKKTYMDNSTVILEKGGLPVAALVSIHDLEKIRNYDKDLFENPFVNFKEWSSEEDKVYDNL